MRPEEKEEKGTIRPRGGNVEMLQKDCLDCCASLKDFSFLKRHLKPIHGFEEGDKSRNCKYFQLCHLTLWMVTVAWTKQTEKAVFMDW